jgi:hypothetical protein
MAERLYACDLGALTADERATHHALAKTLMAAVQERTELTNGYAFRLAPAHLEMAARWASNERRCCPFFVFELELGPDEGPLWLHVTGGPGIKEFIRSEFRLD